MPERFVAFLRAINVGGRFVKMPLLRHAFEEMGFTDVATFIASGNVIFNSELTKGRDLELQIEAGLEDALGFEVATFVRAEQEIGRIGRRASDLEEVRDEPNAQLLVGFLGESPDDAARSRLADLDDEGNRFDIDGRELYWSIAGRTSDSNVSGAQIEKRLGMPTTTRNIRTVRRLEEKLSKT